MKKFSKILLILILTIATVKTVSAAEVEKEVKLWIHGNLVQTDAKPFIEDSTTLVPIRVISETLGYNVNWSQDKHKVAISDFDKETNKFKKLFILTIDEKTIVEYSTEKLNNLIENKTLEKEDINKALMASAKISKTDVAPTIKDERTFVPIRLVAELMGEKVDWDKDNWTVVIGEGYNQEDKTK